MTFMTWSDNYLTGIEAIDRQHKTLVAMINDAAPALAATALAVDVALPLLDGLLDYVAAHFQTEERIMVRSGIDSRHLQHHQAVHGEFHRQVLALRRRVESGDDLDGTEVLRFLSNWLAFHILGEDQRMARELKAIGAGIAAGEAYERTEGGKAEILQGANDVLVNALVNLFSQMTEQNRALAEKNAVLQVAHRELDTYRRTLEQQVETRTAELRQAKEAAEAASHAKSRFLGTVSHELLTPLNAILGFAHLLEQSEIPPKAKEQANRIGAAGKRLQALLGDVLQFSRLEAGEVNIDYAPFQAAALLARLQERLAKSAYQKGLALTCDSDPALPALLGDQHLLGLALEALVNNAVKFTESGTVQLRVRLLDRNNSRLLLSFEVEDTGGGIAPERQNQLFGAFEQLDATTSRRFEGIGLGLAIAARLAKLLGGELTLDSTPGGGSVFRISLWLAAVDAQAVPVGSGQSLDRDATSAALNQLKMELSQSNIVARKRFGELRPFLSTLDAAAAQTMAQQIDNYAFDEALLTLNRITAALGQTLPADGTASANPDNRTT